VPRVGCFLKYIIAKILAKLSFSQSLDRETKTVTKSLEVGRDLDDLRFVAEIINASGRRLVIEDFHYLSPAQRKSFAFDLKALWDYKTFVVIIGIWAENNLLLHLNPDLTLRIEEVPISWSSDDLRSVLENGSKALNIEFSSKLYRLFIDDAFGTVGILQKMALATLDEHGVDQTQNMLVKIDNERKYEDVAMHYAEPVKCTLSNICDPSYWRNQTEKKLNRYLCSHVARCYGCEGGRSYGRVINRRDIRFSSR